MTIDGVGEWATMSRGFGLWKQHHAFRRNPLSGFSRYALYMFHSVLVLYANGGEGKTMGLAGHGKPKYLKELQSIVHVREDGSFQYYLKYFSYRAGNVMWSSRFEKLFGGSRQKASELTERHFDLAATVQRFLEDVLIMNARLLRNQRA